MSTAQQQIRELKKELQELSSIVEKQAKELGKDVKEFVGNGNGHLHITREELHEMAERAGQSTRAFLKEKRKQAEKAAHHYEDAVGAHPWKSTGLALAGGILLGVLLRR